VGCFPVQLARSLRDRLSLDRAIETGTYKGDGLRELASLFPEAISIEISKPLAAAARGSLARVSNAKVIDGNSREELPRLVDPAHPTLYWLDGHYSGFSTGGQEDECPVLGELVATAAGHPDDCILIDDARLFLATPPAPHDPAMWPTFAQIFETLRADRPTHYITMLHDIVIAIPEVAKPDADAFARARVSQGNVAFARRALRRSIRRTLSR
jgi:hypothetical protein